MTPYILILFLATSSSSQAGTGAIAQEFTSREMCMAAGTSLVAEATQRGNRTLVWGCYLK